MGCNFRLRNVLLGTITAVAATALTLWAASSIPITAVLTTDCPNCATDAGGLYANPVYSNGVYSLLPDTYGAYSQTSSVESQILNHNTVYTLNTMNTLVNGLVAGSTRTVNMHFFSTVAGTPGDNLPSCWGIGNNGDINQAVNWSIFSENSQSFTTMQTNGLYPGHSRLDFNVRPQCDGQIYRFYLEWPAVTIVRQNSNTWLVTSSDTATNPCNDPDTDSDTDNCGTASLYGQGGKHGQTVYYGDWRMPFQIQLTQ